MLYFCRHVIGSAVALRVDLRLIFKIRAVLTKGRRFPRQRLCVLFSHIFSSGFLEGLFALGQALSAVVQQLVSCVGAAACYVGCALPTSVTTFSPNLGTSGCCSPTVAGLRPSCTCFALLGATPLQLEVPGSLPRVALLSPALPRFLLECCMGPRASSWLSCATRCYSKDVFFVYRSSRTWFRRCLTHFLSATAPEPTALAC